MDQMLILKEKLQFINDLIIDKSDVVYFEYPIYLNVGDLLIYHGTEKFFTDNGINIRLRRSGRAFSLEEAKKVINNSTTILCQGGGNFGDLYGIAQRVRESLIKEFPNNRIIVLPQTLFFSNDEALKESAKIFKKHTDCHLFARDEKSYELMKLFSDNVYLSPDMAHQLYGSLEQFDKRKTKHEVMYFLRKDEEASDSQDLSSAENRKDWDDLVHSNEKFIAYFAWFLSEFSKKTKLYFLNDYLNDYWFKLSKKIISRCEKEFLSYNYIETDRLHGHIFSCLLGIPNKVLDNSYGKNSSYSNLWTKNISFVTKDE